MYEQHIQLKINDDPPWITNVGCPLRIFSCLRIVLDSQVQLGAFVPGCSKIGRQLHCAVQMSLAGSQVVALHQKSSVLIFKKTVEMTATLTTHQPLLTP